MPRFRLIPAALLILSAPLAAQPHVAEVFTVDQAHSLLDFTTRLLGFNRVRGNFGTWQADFVWDPAAPMAGFVRFTADIASIATQEEERDHDLKAESFFNAERFPGMTFEGRVVAAAGPKLEIEGRLTIRDSTRVIRFPAELITPEAIDPFGNRRLVFAATVRLNRRDFGVVGPAFWNHAIADSATIEMELAGRIWKYRGLGFRRGAYYSPALVAAADSGRFDQTLGRLSRELAAEADSTRLPTPFEMEIAAGQLTQAGKAPEALRLLELFAPVAARWSPDRRSRYETRLGEVLLRLGRAEEARRHLKQAIALDSTGTNAQAWFAAASWTP